MKTCTALLAALMATPALAQNDSAALDPLVVTPTRSETRAGDVAASIMVFTRADIERLQPRDLADLLGSLPGVTVARNGGPGQTTSVFLRGNEARHTLVLINGHRAGTVELPNFSWEYLPVEDIERIEIVPGARSSLYGSQAFGGVIQIFTRTDQRTQLTAEGGTQRERGGSVHTGYANRAVQFALDAGAKATQGSDATDAGTFGHDPDRDGFRERHAGAHLVTPFDTAELSADTLYSSGRTQFDSIYDDFKLQQHNAGLHWRPDRDTTLSIDAGRASDRRDFDQAANFGFFSDSRRDTASAQYGQVFAGGSGYTLGYDYADDHYEAQGTAPTSRSSRAEFLNVRPRFGALSVELGGRYERDAAFGSVTTGQLGLRYDAGPVGFFTHGGSAFRAPTFQERYGGPFNVANPGLKPEHGRSYEVGVDGRVYDVKLSLSAFRNFTRDLIQFTAGADGIPFTADDTYANVARTRMQGLELRASGRWDDTRLALGSSYTDARDEDTHTALIRRPRCNARLDVDQPFGAVSLGTSLEAEGRRPDAGTTLAGYALLDLRAGWTQTRDIAWEVSVHNALDRGYSTVAGYRGEPRTAILRLRWTL